MKIMAFLQNQWFLHPEQMERIYARHGGGWDGRAALNRVYLFFRCRTGQRLRTAFGEDFCDSIIWENASAKMAGESDGVFPADIEHIAGAVRHHRPDVIMAFGRVACGGVADTKAAHPELFPLQLQMFCGPHPAARHATVTTELRAMAEQVRALTEAKAA